MSYQALYLTHVGAVIASGALFFARGVMMLHAMPLLQAKFLRIAPHVVDTVLLVSALALTTVVQQYPFRDGWLTAKLGWLVIYIVLGTIAIRRGRTRRIRTIAFIAALAVFVYIVLIARIRTPWPLPG